MKRRSCFTMLCLILVGSACSGSPSTGISTTTEVITEFTVSSSAMEDGGILPIDYTCDGSSTSPPISWSNAPSGTESFAVLMDHQPGPGDWHWYWTLWNIDASTNELPSGSNGDAIVGTNSVNGELAYTPPCSKGPGAKAYNITVYALSGEPELSDPSNADRAALLDAIVGITLASDTLTVTYTRS